MASAGGHWTKGGRYVSWGQAAHVAARLSDFAHGGGLHFEDDVGGSSYGQTTGTLLARDAAGAVLGGVDYTVYSRRARINWVQVKDAAQGRSIGKRLIAKLQAEHPDKPVEWTYTTPSGALLKRSYEKMTRSYA